VATDPPCVPVDETGGEKVESKVDGHVRGICTNVNVTLCDLRKAGTRRSGRGSSKDVATEQRSGQHVRLPASGSDEAQIVHRRRRIAGLLLLLGGVAACLCLVARTSEVLQTRDPVCGERKR
jgi:hypothetical protein